MLGRYNYAEAITGLSEHRHAGAVEICYLARGRQTYCVGEESFHLRGGDLFMTLPNEEHGTGGAPQEKGLLYWFILLDPAETGGSMLGLTPDLSRALWGSLTRSRRRHFPGTTEMQRHLDEVIRIMRNVFSPLSRTEICNRLTACLLEVVTKRDEALNNDGNGRFSGVLDHLKIHLLEPEEITVGKLAMVAGLSLSRFKASFKQETGIPPAEYVLRERISEARRRLSRTGVTVTEVAFDLGFSSSQYFASVFKRFTNRTPRQLQGKR